ncbi:MAG: hypothetical protein HKN42_04785 [Granulosicoccus sp.]|nr:hypothetical protein [Granulosicoccus sp.]
MKSQNHLEAASGSWTQEHAAQLRTMIEGAAWAPFHRRADEKTHRSGKLNSVVPWRFYILEQSACHSLLNHLKILSEDDPDPKWARAWQSKIKNMLAACGALVQVTWLPDPPDEGDTPQFTRNNIEHVAASAAAVQNLLLASAARGWYSYWSSGGILGDEVIFDYLNISRHQALLGSVFLAPVLEDEVTVVDGGLRDQRGAVEAWARWQ